MARLDALGTFASSTKIAFPDRKSKSRGWSLAIVDERTSRVLHHVLPSAILGLFLFDFERGYSFYWCCKVFGLLLASGWFFMAIGFA
jgi:hypothetical protein